MAPMTAQAATDGTALPPSALDGYHEASQHTPACFAVFETLARIGDKWGMVLLLFLRDGSRRFGELKRRVPGISQRMLTLTLRNLERDGLVERSVHPSVPPRVDYQLTPLGHSMCEPIEALGVWAKEHASEVRAARQRFDSRDDSGDQRPV